jgi:8-oxo-dGTP pyrophosphatase MutT (NUDIX family)
VAIVIGHHHGTSCFVLTERASTLRVHAGQYALPGGTINPNETPAEAALRELSEEADLQCSGNSIVGRLDDYRTMSGYLISPFVVWGDDLGSVRPNSAEVAEVLHIPLTALAGPAVPTLLRLPGREKPIIQVPLDGERVVHAPTGAILYQFAELYFRERHIDVRAFDEPDFAWT